MTVSGTANFLYVRVKPTFFLYVSPQRPPKTAYFFVYARNWEEIVYARNWVKFVYATVHVIC